MIESIDSKLISVCLINDYSFIADLNIFVYERTECPSISLECTKVKLLILNNFAQNQGKRLINSVFVYIYCSIERFYKLVSFRILNKVELFFIKNVRSSKSHKNLHNFVNTEF